MRNEIVDDEFGPLIGRWTMTMSDAWFLEPPDDVVHGTATFEWIGDAFVHLHTESPDWEFVIGRSDAQDRTTVLYWDDRGTCRVFASTLEGGRWTLLREDPDFHQRFVATVTGDRIEGRWEVLEDDGSWRKDFDLTFEREA